MGKAKTITFSTKGFTYQGERLKYQKLVKKADEEKTIAVYGKSYAECVKKMEVKEAEWKTAVIQGSNLRAGHAKLYEAMSDYFDSHKQYIKGNSYLSKKTRLDNQIKHSALANKRADNVTHMDIQKLIDKLAEDGYTKSTVKHVRECFTEYYGNLYGRYSQMNPALGIKLPVFEDELQIEVDENHILTDMEIKTFFVECEKPSSPHHFGCHYSDMFKFLVLTYMRSGEACALQVKDFFDLPDGHVRKKNG